MKHILYVASIVLPLVCGANIAMAFVPGVPPASGPGSVFHGNEEAPPNSARAETDPEIKTEPEVAEATFRCTAKITRGREQTQCLALRWPVMARLRHADRPF